MNEQLHGCYSRVTMKSSGTEFKATNTQVSDTIRAKYMKDRYKSCNIRLVSFPYFNRGGYLSNLKLKRKNLNLNTIYVDSIAKEANTTAVGITYGVKGQTTSRFFTQLDALLKYDKSLPRIMLPCTIEVVQYMMAQSPEWYTDTYHVTLISNDDVSSNNHILYDMETFPAVR